MSLKFLCLITICSCTAPIGGLPASGSADAGGAPSTAQGGGGAATAGAGGLLLTVSPPDSGGSMAVGNGQPELCDGIDNDLNGNIDDVDAGGDGVCDCLNIATIGQIGPHSNGGNIFTAWLNARSPRGAVALDDQVLTPEVLLPFQVVVVLHAATFEMSNNGRTAAAHHAFTDSEVTAFDAWLRQGGGAMTTIGYTNREQQEIVNVNRLIAPAGIGYSTTKFELGGQVKSWNAHPVTAGISEIKADNGVEPAGAGMALAHVEGNNGTALQVLQTGEGRILVWGDEWITYDSEWTDNQQVELFWLNILKWLSPPGECQVPIPPRVK